MCASDSKSGVPKGTEGSNPSRSSIGKTAFLLPRFPDQIYVVVGPNLSTAAADLAHGLAQRAVLQVGVASS